MAHLIHLIELYGLAFVFVNVLALQAGLPFPAYPTLIVTGALAAKGHYTTAALLATAVVASVVSDTGWYIAGRRFGGRVLRTLCRVSLSPDTCVRQTEGIFERYGAPSLAVAKFVPGFASVATAMAGAVRISVWRFLVFDAIGAALWSGVAIALGYIFSAAIGDIIAVFDRMGRWGVWVLGAGFVAYIVYRWVQRQRFLRQLRMDRVTVDELHELMSEGQLGTVVDVRSPFAQALTGRIPGAITIDVNDVRAGLSAVSTRGEVVVYCACPNEASAAKVAKALVQNGFKRVRPLAGGIDAWIESGFEVEAIGEESLGATVRAPQEATP
jgi:membrane protein DedA with SNARE-associated domain/rhodanese-related sulfurtransferase